MSKWITVSILLLLALVWSFVGWKVGNYYYNYKTSFRGLPITIEFRKGDVKSGTDVFGNEWSKVLKHHYGYFDGIEGADGQELDVYINPDAKFINSSKIFRIEQLDAKTGEFDEHKIMLGFDSIMQARQAYLSNMPRKWDRDRVSQDGLRKCGIGVTSEISLNELTNERD